MNTPQKISRCGFAVMKLLVDGRAFYLMRYSKKWHDVSFIGGHEMERDASKLSRVAYREFMEEVPTFRSFGEIELAPLTNEFCYGPVYSESAKTVVGYELQFFLLKFLSSPIAAIAELGPRSPNILLPESALREKHTYKLAALVELLSEVYPGGLEAIPLSWRGNISLFSFKDRDPQYNQLRLRLFS